MFTHHLHNRRSAAYIIGTVTFFACGLSASAQSRVTRESAASSETSSLRVASDGVANEAGDVAPPSDPSVTATPAKLLEQGEAALAEIAVARTNLTELVAAAKDKRDVVKVLCLDDKSGQVEAALRTTEERVESLAMAATHGADERARHEYLMVVTLKERVSVLMSEANQCLGEEAGFTGDSALNVEIDPNLPRVVAEVVPFSPVLFIPVSLNSGVY